MFLHNSQFSIASSQQTNISIQYAKYIDEIRSVKPGITGLWQTSGRNDLNFEQRAQLDSKYIRNQSICNELLIILKTPFCMISRW